MDVQTPAALVKSVAPAGIQFGKLDFGEKKEKKKGPTDAAAMLKLVWDSFIVG